MPAISDPANVWSDDDARRALDECKRTGVSLAEFSRRHGIAPGRMYWWKARLAGKDWNAAPPSVKKRDAKSAAPARLRMVPAAVVGIARAVTIRLPSGILIELESGSSRWIAEVVTELTRTPR